MRPIPAWVHAPQASRTGTFAHHVLELEQVMELVGGARRAASAR